MAYTLSPNLKLRLDSNLTANSRFNLLRIDELGGVFTVDNTGTVRIRSEHGIAFSANDAGIGGTGIGGDIQFGAPGQPLDTFTVYTNSISFGPGVLPTANGGTGQNSTALFPTSGVVVTEAGTETLTNKTMDGGSNTFTGIPLSSAVTGVLPILNGGTGQTSANAAFNALAPSQATHAGQVLTTDGTNTSWTSGAGGGGTVTSIDVSGGTTGLTTTGGPITTTGTITLAGTLSLANGGTGATSAAGATAALNLFSSSLQGLVPASGGGTTNFLRADGTWAVAGSGTVTSVGLSAPVSILSVSGSPVTGSGTLALSLATQAANTVWAGPTSGGAATPTFRALVPADFGGSTSFSATWPQIAGTSLTVTHNLGTTDVQVGIYDLGTGNTIDIQQVDRTDVNTVVLTASEAPGSAGWRVVVLSAGLAVMGSGSVTLVSVATANGISGTVATPSTTPAITLSLGAITPTSVAASGTVTGSNLSGSSSGTNTGDQTISLTGDVTGSGTGSFVASIASNAVTNSKLALMPANTIKGNNTGAPGTALDLSITQTTAMLNLFTNTLQGLVPASGGGTVNFLRADGTWSSIPASGTVTSVSSSGGTTGLTLTTTNPTTTPSLLLAGVLGPVNGGTGVSSYSTGGTLYASASNTLAVLPVGTDGYVLTVASGVPVWAAASGGISALTGDVTASGSGIVPATVAFVGTSSAANVHAAELLANAATSSNTINTIVKRDASGNFIAGTITANLVGANPAGLVTVTGGPAASGGAGGNATIAGAVGSSVTTGGAGGTLNLNGGAAGGDGTVNQAGGPVSIIGGQSKGSAAGGGITLTSGTGGLGTGTAGATGGTTHINGGTGGVGSATSGNGGGATLKAGSGGNGVAGGTGGSASVTGGTGGTGSSTGGNGGAVTVTGGSPGSVAGAGGGSATLAGAGGTSTGSGGAGGAVTITGGSSNAGDNSVNRTGGSITMTAGVGGGAGNGGALTASSGAGGIGSAAVGGNGGNHVMNAGAGGTNAGTGGTGGALQFNAGAGGASAGTPGTGGIMQFFTAATTSLVERLRINATQVMVSSADLVVNTVGNGLQIKSGTHGRIGTAVLVGGTVTVANTSVTATTRIFLTSNTDGGTPGWLRVSAKVNGTSFTITSSSGTDTSTVAWVLIESV